MRKVIFFLMAILVSQNMSAQDITGSLEGYIYTSDNKPASYVTVSIKSLKKTQ